MLRIIVRLVLIIVLITAYSKLPIEYYLYLRITLFVGFLYLSIKDLTTDELLIPPICGFLAALFNPIIKLPFSKRQWMTMDVWVIAFIIGWLIYDLNKYLKARNKDG